MLRQHTEPGDCIRRIPASDQRHSERSDGETRSSDCVRVQGASIQIVALNEEEGPTTHPSEFADLAPKSTAQDRNVKVPHILSLEKNAAVE